MWLIGFAEKIIILIKDNIKICRLLQKGQMKEEQVSFYNVYPSCTGEN